MARPREKRGTMSAEVAAVLSQHRNLCREAEANRAKVQGVRARMREHMEKINELETTVRGAKNRYQHTLNRQVAGEAEENVVKRAKEEVANVEADLAEAKGTLEALKAELPRLEEAAPDGLDAERAKWAAWDAISQDLKAQVPQKTHELVVKIYAATLIHHHDAPFSVALTAICPAPPGRQRCSELAVQLAKRYNIPVS